MKTKVYGIAIWTTVVMAVATPLLQAAQPNQSWRVKVNSKAAALKLQNDAFYIGAVDEKGAVPSYSYAGSMSGYQPDVAGLYVIDLDGTGNSSVAFFEVNQHKWFYSALSSDMLNFQPGTGEILHVGDGPYLYPISGRDGIATTRPAALAQPAAVSNAQSATFPVQLTQHTKLATSRSMDTSVTIYNDGSLYAVTSVHNGVWLSGYHGQSSISVVDTNGVEQIRYESMPIGVTGTAFGHPEAVGSWQVVVPDNIRNNMKGIAIYQNWLPEFNTIPRDTKQWADLISQLIKWIPGLK